MKPFFGRFDHPPALREQLGRTRRVRAPVTSGCGSVVRPLAILCLVVVVDKIVDR